MINVMPICYYSTEKREINLHFYCAMIIQCDNLIVSNFMLHRIFLFSTCTFLLVVLFLYVLYTVIHFSDPIFNREKYCYSKHIFSNLERKRELIISFVVYKLSI